MVQKKNIYINIEIILNIVENELNKPINATLEVLEWLCNNYNLKGYYPMQSTIVSLIKAKNVKILQFIHTHFIDLYKECTTCTRQLKAMRIK